MFDNSPIRFEFERRTPIVSGADDLDGWINVSFPGGSRSFPAVLSIKPTARNLDRLAALKRQLNSDSIVLIAPQIADPLVKRCQELGLGCLDLNGRIWISAPNFLIDRSPRDRKFKPATPFPNLFREKSSRIARILLSNPRREWTQADLVKRAGISIGLVSRLLNSYLQLGLVEKESGFYRLTQFDALLDLWAKEDRFERRVISEEYSVLGNLDELAKELQSNLKDGVAFTQWVAANRRFPFTTTPFVTAYVKSDPTDEFLKQFTARKVNEGGNLRLYCPADEGVFQETQTVDELTLVCDAQIYLDLLSAGFRASDHAQALRNWSGFANRNER